MNEAQLKTLIEAATAQAFPLLCLADFMCKKGVLDRDELIAHLQNSVLQGARPVAFSKAAEALIGGLLVTGQDDPPT